MNLREKFVNLLTVIGFDTSKIEVLWRDLEKAYSGKSRYYHNLTHLEEMVALYEQYQLMLKFPTEILYAIFYHDYIYKSTSKNNELESAKWAVFVLPPKANLNIDLVFDAICATELHERNEIEDINWLIDFDLKILSKKWADYEIYLNQIRKEYKIYPDFLYNAGRAKALQHFLENGFIFKTNEFRKLFEDNARANITKEIYLLT